jgi:Ca2+-binding EF-hand superfamily protein
MFAHTVLTSRKPSSRRHRRGTVLAWCAAGLMLLGDSPLRLNGADNPPQAKTAQTAPAGATTDEIRDTFLLLDSGPLHLRLHIAVGAQSPGDARKATVQRLLESLDTDKDGQLSRDEAQRSPLFREKQRPGAAAFIKSIGADLKLKPRDIEQRLNRAGGETVTYRQNTATSDSDSIVFQLLDANADKVVDADEMFEAVDLLLARDMDDDECVTLDEVTPAPDPMAMTAVNTLNPVPRPPAPTVAELLGDTNQTLFTAQLIQKYDKNRNQKLSAEELNWTAEKITPCDSDKDGQLNVRELANIKRSPADIEMAVDVIRPKDGGAMLKVLSTRVERSDDERYPDLATISMPQAVITFSTREVDPFETSMAIAVRTFNELDQDNNGYLDRDETMLRERFQRELFDKIDADGDNKIFGEEMKEFIRANGEPTATTCQITVFDDGAGFFSALDTNGDRRISMREMRYADKTLSAMQQDKNPGLGEKEPSRRYRIEFVRGVFNPFGNTDRPMVNPNMPQAVVAQARPRPVGPIWFQRWDRNNDGDITWREFLGPRDVFEQLDTDRDELIDPKEAAAAAAPMSLPKSLSQPTASRP